MKIKKFLFPTIVIAFVVGGGWWFLTPSGLPGQKVTDLGREHLKESDPEPEYNSNPPTSGAHSPQWLAAGYYEEGKSDRQLLHSLEHGYVVVSYNCEIAEKSEVRGERLEASFDGLLNASLSMPASTREVRAHGEEATESGSRGIKGREGGGGKEGDDGACHELQDYLKELVKDFGVWKIVAAPRSKNDSRIALTAWGRIDKFNSLDKQRIERFIKAWRDKGPEATRD